jgi:hypothetical protein
MKVKEVPTASIPVFRSSVDIPIIDDEPLLD